MRARAMTRYSGEMLIGTGLLHTAVGLSSGRGALAGIARDGVLDAVDPHLDRHVALWFLMTGAGFIATGSLARWSRRRTGELPAGLGWQLLLEGVAGAALLPRSGFWVLIPQGLLILAAGRGTDARR